MPDRAYLFTSGVPTRTERLYAHPFSFAAFASWILYGGVSIAEGFGSSALTKSAVSTFPLLVALAVGLLFIFGGIVGIWSIFSETKRLDIIFKARKLACTLAIAAGGIYMIFVMRFLPLDVMAIFFAFSQALAGLLGFASTVATERHTRQIMREQGYVA